MTAAILAVKHLSRKNDSSTPEKEKSEPAEVDYIEPEEQVSDQFIRLATSDKQIEPMDKARFAGFYIPYLIFLILLAFTPSEQANILFVFGLGVFIGKVVL